MEQALRYEDLNIKGLPKSIAMKEFLDEDTLFFRHIRARKHPETVCEFTTDKALLHQYYVLRSIHLSKVLPTPMPVGPDSYDERSHIMVVRMGNQVVGGARILTRQHPKDSPLYIERGNWNMTQVLPELGIEEHPYCELSKMFLLEEFQNSSIVNSMYKCILQKCVELKLDYAFSTSSPSAARAHKRALIGTSVRVKILNNITVPTEGPERADNRTHQHLTLFALSENSLLNLQQSENKQNEKMLESAE